MMINSKPPDRPFLDHDQVEDRSGNIYMVVGNLHPPNAVVAYLKYTPTDTPTYWRRGRTYYRRIIRNYGVRNVKDSTRDLQEKVKDEVLGTELPVIKLSNIHYHYLPEVRLRNILCRAGDKLEARVLKLIDLLRQYTAICSSSLGIDGSILPGIHNPDISDIDMIVYGCKESIEVVEGLKAHTEKRIDAVLQGRLKRQSRIYGLPLGILREIQPPHRYIRIDGTEVNISFVNNTSKERYGFKIYVPIAQVEARLVLRHGECAALYYPSTASVDRVADLRIIGCSRFIEYSSVKYVVSYEGLFSYLMYLGGEVIVKGILEEVLPDRYYIVLVGAYENPGYVIPASKKMFRSS
ncbi:MAG: hypothetical protein J7J11_02085 [Desulfurococcales archaeon]|nr:hypothetical protein [Desulfurococcales archaeon]